MQANGLENDMIIEGTITRLLNENEVRSTDIYHVSLERDDSVRLTKVEKGKFGNYHPVEGDVTIISEDNPSRKLSEYNFLGFVKIIYQSDKERQRVTPHSKSERIAKLFEGISQEDILEFLKSKRDE